MADGLWIIDDATGEERFLYYSELEEETRQQLCHPIGGFIFPAGMFMSAHLPDVPFYVQDWLPKRGKALLYAPAKSGKSYLSTQMARCIACGDNFLDKKTTKGKVLYVQFELGEEIFQSRLKKTGQDYDGVWVGTTFSMKLDSKEGQDRLRRAVEAVEPNVLILDPWYKTLKGDENESHDVLPVLDYLDSLIEGFDCAIQIIHHSGKDLSKRGRGTSVLEDWVDSYIQMQRVSKDGETLKVKIKPVFLRHAANPPEPVTAELRNFEFEVVGSALSVNQQVEKFFVENPTGLVCPGDLFNFGIGSNTSVYKALKELEKEKKIEKVEWGKYKWVEKKS